MHLLTILEAPSYGVLNFQDDPSRTLARRYRMNFGGNCLVALSLRGAPFAPKQTLL
jgi:hypothetical protein